MKDMGEGVSSNAKYPLLLIKVVYDGLAMLKVHSSRVYDSETYERREEINVQLL